jgi:phage tail-like protein
VPPILRDDPYAGYNFEIVINGISDDGTAVKGSFSEVSGLDAEVSPIEYRNGSEDITVRKVPGLKKFTNITLKRGIIGDLALWNWILDAMKGQVVRTEGAILLLDESRKEVMRWTFKRGWPCKYSGPTLNAKNNEIAMEMLEICHEGLDIDGEAG